MARISTLFSFRILNASETLLFSSTDITLSRWAIVTKTPYDLDISKEGQIVAENLQNLSVNDKSVNTIDAVYSLEDTVKAVIDGLMSKHTPSAVIVDRDRNPVGIANVVDLLLLPAGTVGIMKVRHAHLEKLALMCMKRPPRVEMVPSMMKPVSEGT